MKDVSRASTLLACALIGGLWVINSGCSASAGLTSPSIPIAPERRVRTSPTPTTTPTPGGAPTPTAAPTPTGAPTPTPTPTLAPNPNVPNIAGCQIFPADNPWNTDVSNYPLDPNSAGYMSFMSTDTGYLQHNFHPNLDSGIPYNVVPSSQLFVPIHIVQYPNVGQANPESYPFPSNALIEGGSSSPYDRHVLVIDSGNCHLYETWKSYYNGTDALGWNVGSAWNFDLGSNALPPNGTATADAAGTPILPGLVLFSQVQAGVINHALNVTVPHTQSAYIYPAVHQSGNVSNSSAPPMGLRFRLKASFDLSPYNGETLIILTALKKYGMIVMDNNGGTNWDLEGEPAPLENDTNLNELANVPVSAFEVVRTGTIIH